MYGRTSEGESEGEGLLSPRNGGGEQKEQQPTIDLMNQQNHQQHHLDNLAQQRLGIGDLMQTHDLEKGASAGLPAGHHGHPHHHHLNHHNHPHHGSGGGGGDPHHKSNKKRRCWNCFGNGGNNKWSPRSIYGVRRRRFRHPRLVDKQGECIIRPNNLQGSFYICMKNWFHLVIEHSWRRIFMLFAGGFLTSWLSFGLAYYLIQHYYYGNLESLSEQQQCIANVHSFTSAFLFSLESQHTIGYGTRYITEMCPLAYATLSLQCIVGVLLQTVLAGIVIAKILRPKKRKQEMRFSTLAVIGPVDDEDPRPCLMIRLADIQHRLYIAESHVRLYMVTTKINKHGGCDLLGVQDMNVGYDTGQDRVLLLWPIVVRHIIDQDSPLWEITEEKLKSCQFELIMTVEGIVEATGMAFQARTSFLPDEILWAQKFVPLISLNPRSNQFEVNYDLFDVTEPHALEPWLPMEDDADNTEALDIPTTKLSVISELDSAMPYALPLSVTHNNGTIGSGTGSCGGPYGNHTTGTVPPLPNGILPPPPAAAVIASLEPSVLHHLPHHPHHAHHQHHQFRRKSTCSIAESIRSGKYYPVHGGLSGDDAGGAEFRLPAPRKSSRSSLLHVLLRRTQTNDSSPLVSNNNICGGGTGTGEDGADGAGHLSPGVELPPLPASPFVVHTLQHSGFT